MNPRDWNPDEAYDLKPSHFARNPAPYLQLQANYGGPGQVRATIVDNGSTVIGMATGRTLGEALVHVGMLMMGRSLLDHVPELENLSSSERGSTPQQ